MQNTEQKSKSRSWIFLAVTNTVGIPLAGESGAPKRAIGQQLGPTCRG
jgi:hypothetical protein